MKKNLLGIAALTLVFMISSAAQTVTAQADNDANSDSIIGTWNSTVTFIDCTTGAVIRSFPTMNTFNTGGTMLETSRSMLQRSPGHGAWERTRGNEFVSVFKFFRSNADGTDNGYQLVRRSHVVNEDSLETTAEFQNFNAAGTFISSGCALESATRLR